MRVIPFVAIAAHLSVMSVGFAQQPCKSTVVGDLHIEHFDSKMYGTSVTVRVWLPPGYGDASNDTRKYPTLYLLDGRTAFDEPFEFFLVNIRECTGKTLKQLLALHGLEEEKFNAGFKGALH
jgi:hypothetical protein